MTKEMKLSIAALAFLTVGVLTTVVVIGRILNPRDNDILKNESHEVGITFTHDGTELQPDIRQLYKDDEEGYQKALAELQSRELTIPSDEMPTEEEMEASSIANATNMYKSFLDEGEDSESILTHRLYNTDIIALVQAGDDYLNENFTEEEIAMIKERYQRDKEEHEQKKAAEEAAYAEERRIAKEEFEKKQAEEKAEREYKMQTDPNYFDKDMAWEMMINGQLTSEEAEIKLKAYRDSQKSAEEIESENRDTDIINNLYCLSPYSTELASFTTIMKNVDEPDFSNICASFRIMPTHNQSIGYLALNADILEKYYGSVDNLSFVVCDSDNFYTCRKTIVNVFKNSDRSEFDTEYNGFNYVIPDYYVDLTFRKPFVIHVINNNSSNKVERRDANDLITDFIKGKIGDIKGDITNPFIDTAYSSSDLSDVLVTEFFLNTWNDKKPTIICYKDDKEDEDLFYAKVEIMTLYAQDLANGKSLSGQEEFHIVNSDVQLVTKFEFEIRKLIASIFRMRYIPEVDEKTMTRYIWPLYCTYNEYNTACDVFDKYIREREDQNLTYTQKKYKTISGNDNEMKRLVNEYFYKQSENIVASKDLYQPSLRFPFTNFGTPMSSGVCMGLALMNLDEYNIFYQNWDEQTKISGRLWNDIYYQTAEYKSKDGEAATVINCNLNQYYNNGNQEDVDVLFNGRFSDYKSYDFTSKKNQFDWNTDTDLSKNDIDFLKSASNMWRKGNDAEYKANCEHTISTYKFNATEYGNAYADYQKIEEKLNNNEVVDVNISGLHFNNKEKTIQKGSYDYDYSYKALKKDDEPGFHAVLIVGYERYYNNPEEYINIVKYNIDRENEAIGYCDSYNYTYDYEILHQPLVYATLKIVDSNVASAIGDMDIMLGQNNNGEYYFWTSYQNTNEDSSSIYANDVFYNTPYEDNYALTFMTKELSFINVDDPKYDVWGTRVSAEGNIRDNFLLKNYTRFEKRTGLFADTAK